MADETADLRKLQKTATALLEQLTPGARSRALNQLAGMIRSFQQRRMKAQVGPDGQAWEKRKPRRPVKPATREMRFVYRNRSGETRQAQMKSWVGRGNQMTGYDVEAGAIRTFNRDRIIARLPVESSGGDHPARKTRGRSSMMFAKMRLNAHLKAGSDPDSAWSEFTSRAARLARIHHGGGRHPVVAGGPEADYPARPLVGWGQGDEIAVMKAFVDQLTSWV